MQQVLQSGTALASLGLCGPPYAGRGIVSHVRDQAPFACRTLSVEQSAPTGSCGSRRSTTGGGPSFMESGDPGVERDLKLSRSPTAGCASACTARQVQAVRRSADRLRRSATSHRHRGELPRNRRSRAQNKATAAMPVSVRPNSWSGGDGRTGKMDAPER